MPTVDVFMEGFLAGAILASLAVYRMHVLEVRRIERQHAFGMRRHPAFKEWSGR